MLTMIEVRDRDPQRTYKDMRSLYACATRETWTPSVWEIGFFCTRDLMKLTIADQERALSGVPYRVVELEDRISLLATRAHVVKRFFIDRRAHGA